MNNQTKLSAQELRKSTTTNFVIFFDGIELPTEKSGGQNSAGGIVLTAFLPELGLIQHRSNDAYGRKGFSFFNEPRKAISSELRARLEYKY